MQLRVFPSSAGLLLGTTDQSEQTRVGVGGDGKRTLTGWTYGSKQASALNELIPHGAGWVEVQASLDLSPQELLLKAPWGRLEGLEGDFSSGGLADKPVPSAEAEQ